MTLTFHHVSFTVSDLDGSLKFYRDLLGLKLKDEPRVVGEGTKLPTTVVGYPGARLKVILSCCGIEPERIRLE